MEGNHKATLGNQSKELSVSLPPAKRMKDNRTEVENNNGSTSTSSISSVEKALRNAVVLKNIFKFLPYRDLQVCRSVDLPRWSSEAEHSISQRLLLKIKIGQSEISMIQTFQNKETRFEFKSIEELSSKLETFKKDHEIWVDVWLSLSPEPVNFLKKFSKAISSLTVGYNNNNIKTNYLSPSDLLKFLRELPNLSHLRLDKAPKISNKIVFNNSSTSESFSLHQIKTIFFNPKIVCYPGFPLSVLHLTPNLSKIFNFPLHCIPDLINNDDLKKLLDKIKSINIVRSHIKNRNWTGEELSQLASSSQRLKLKAVKIHLPLYDTPKIEKKKWESGCESLTTILENSKSTLEFIKIQPLAFPQYLKYPEMKAVKELSLYGRRYDKGSKFFVKNFNVGQTFPNLIEVTLESWLQLEKFLSFFPEDAFARNYFQGVTSLNFKFKAKGEVGELKKVPQLFPDVTSLTVEGDLSWLKSHLPHIFGLWPKLINLKVLIGKTSGLIKYPLDSVFTGIFEGKCNKLRKEKRKLDINFEKNRKNLAISNMKDLKELTLIFDDLQGGSGEEENNPLISHVAVFYGFQCVPDLKVTCAIPGDNYRHDEIREMLRPIEKYVDFKPNYAKPLDLDEKWLD